jgi:hypothetical protein
VPLNRNNTRTFHRALYAGLGMLQAVTLLKRDDNQRQGTVTEYKLFQCRWTRITRLGQTIEGDIQSDNRRTLHIPRIEMDRIGISYFNPLDRFVDEKGRTWQPESPSTITIQLFENWTKIDCTRVD